MVKKRTRFVAFLRVQCKPAEAGVLINQARGAGVFNWLISQQTFSLDKTGTTQVYFISCGSCVRILVGFFIKQPACKAAQVKRVCH